MSRHERNGWRDEWISLRHRSWGRHVPAVDLDCIVTTEGAEMGENGWNVLEYDNLAPVALVEYKARAANLTWNTSLETLRRLADMASLPFFVVVYDQEKLQFGVLPKNERAQKICPQNLVLTEAGYVNFLHRLRGRQPPARQEIA